MTAKVGDVNVDEWRLVDVLSRVDRWMSVLHGSNVDLEDSACRGG